MSQEKLQALKEATDKAIEKAQEKKSDFSSCAVNWGRLSCTDAESTHSLSNSDVAYTVCVEEADPSSKPLADFISNALYAGGFGDVEIQLGW